MEGTEYVPPSLTLLCDGLSKNTSLSPCGTDAPWQIIDKKKKKGAGSKTAAEVETTNIQLGFVAAKGSVPVNSGKKRKLEEAEI